MKHVGCVLLLVVGACIVKKDDGATCDTGEDCSSGNCLGNLCIGSDCHGGSCPTNFACEHSDGDPIFGIGGGDHCEPVCDASGECPAQWQCNPGQRYCEYVGPKVTVSISNMQPMAHEVVTFTGTIDPPRSNVTWTWDFLSLGQKTGPMIEMMFDKGDWNWAAQATGPDGAEHYEDGILHVCAIAGDACTPYGGDCCGMLSCNPSTAHCE